MKHPKRRRFRDNPYSLINNDMEYLIVFKKANNETQKINVSKEVYDMLDRFELDDLKELNEYDRHLEHSEMFDGELYKKAISKSKLTDEVVEQKIEFEELYKAINSLSKVQKRRIKMYYFKGLNLREIADIEKCSIMSVKNSLDSGIIKLKNFLKK